jgi:DNA-binding response OmpR family regulator
MKNEPQAAKEKLQANSTRGKKILIADDDDFMRFAIGHRLKEEGFQILTANDGGEAMDYLKKEKPDLIILDLMMPYVSGPEFLHQMNARYEPEMRAPVIIISAIDKLELIEGGYKLEGYQFIRKPFTLDDLVHAVNHILSFGSS